MWGKTINAGKFLGKIIFLIKKMKICPFPKQVTNNLVSVSHS